MSRYRSLLTVWVSAAITPAAWAASPTAVLDPAGFASLGILDVASGTVTIDTNALTITGVADNGVLHNQGTSTQNGVVDFCRNIAVFNFDSINIDPSVTITIIGSRPLALLSKGDATLGPAINIGGVGGGGGGGDWPIHLGPGGGPGGGLVGEVQIGNTPKGGSGGGSFAETGGTGGNYHGGTAGTGGTIYGGSTLGILSYLQGGSGGGGNVSAGGNGGGAIEIGAVGTLTLNGNVQAIGGGSGSYGGGGGSGGGIVLHAASIVKAGTISAAGGTGGSGAVGGGGGAGGRVALLGYPASYTYNTGFADGTLNVSGGNGGATSFEGTPGAAGSAGAVIIDPLETIVPTSEALVIDGLLTPIPQGPVTQTNPSVQLLPRHNLHIQSEGLAQVATDEALLPSAAVVIDGGVVIAGNPPTLIPGGTFELVNAQQTVGRLTGGGGVGPGFVSLKSSQLMVGYGDESSTFSGVISGQGGALVKLGAGTFELNSPFQNAGTYTGNTKVTAGRLLVNTAQSPAVGTNNLSVQTGAELGGEGVISARTLIEGGATLAPGNDVGTLRMQDLELAGNSHLAFELGTPTSDLIQIVNGKFTSFPPVKVRITDAGGLASGQTYALIDCSQATGANTQPTHFILENSLVTGTFSFASSQVRFTVTGFVPPHLIRAASRRTHGAAGPFDIDLPLSGPAAIEPRVNGSSPQAMFTFDANVEPADGGLNCGQEIVIANGTCQSASIAGNVLTVNMTFTNSACITITLNGLRRANDGPALEGDNNVQVVVQQGNVNGISAANILDLQAIKNQLNQPVSASNFKLDVTCNGAINILDLQATKNNLNQPAACP